MEREFRASHAIVMGGHREATHGHLWRVVVTVVGSELDRDGLLCDFHVLERRLDAILDPLRDRDLNETPPFDRVNPTAENVARFVHDQLATAPVPLAQLCRVCVTEAPGCTATYTTNR